MNRYANSEWCAKRLARAAKRVFPTGDGLMTSPLNPAMTGISVLCALLPTPEVSFDLAGW